MVVAAKKVGENRYRERFGRYYEDFTSATSTSIGPARTISEADNTWFTLLTMNTHPMHFDAEYAKHSEFGRCIVCSPLTVALMVGMSVTDVSQKAIANLGWSEIKLTHPLFAGDTLSAESEVLDKRESESRPNAGIVTVQTRGFNQDGEVVCVFDRTMLVAKRRLRYRRQGEILTGDAMDRADASTGRRGAILDAVEKWLERDVRAACAQVRPRRRVSDRDGRADEGARAVRRDDLARSTAASGLSATTYAQDRREDRRDLDVAQRHLQQPPDHGGLRPAPWHAEQKTNYLPKFATGEIRGGLALTEPDAGTDLQGIRTRATRDGNGYVINGTKTWISNGIYGTCFALLVKTDPEAQPRHKGMSCFIAEKAPGFTVSKKLEKLGYKGIDSAELIFDNYRISGDKLLGGERARACRPCSAGSSSAASTSRRAAAGSRAPR